MTFQFRKKNVNYLGKKSIFTNDRNLQGRQEFKSFKKEEIHDPLGQTHTSKLFCFAQF